VPSHPSDALCKGGMVGPYEQLEPQRSEALRRLRQEGSQILLPLLADLRLVHLVPRGHLLGAKASIVAFTRVGASSGRRVRSSRWPTSGCSRWSWPGARESAWPP